MTSSATALESILKRQRMIVLSGLIGLVALAWIYLGFESTRMAEMGMAEMDMAMMQMRSWTALETSLTFAMWAIMMVAMMVPSAAPTILLYGLVRRKKSTLEHVLAPTGAFALGYIIAWVAFSVLATALQYFLHREAYLSAGMTLNNAVAAGLLMVAVGVYQLTPTKEACLKHCRSPAEFLSRHWRKGTGGAVIMGLHHGLYCLGCCWGLMALLFVGGVMNLLWVALLAGFVLIEKLTPMGHGAARIAGLILLLAGGAIALQGALA
jgi:predicted metal-binding membrane protein